MTKMGNFFYICMKKIKPESTKERTTGNSTTQFQYYKN
jgi:hypothetical protein